MYKALISFCNEELDIAQGEILASDFASAEVIADLLEAGYIEEYTDPSGGAEMVVVTELPETGEANVIYLVPKETEDENNVFDEYLYINNEWELIGTTDIDLSNYLAKDNTTSYTPTTDYHPATKKYVDDAVAGAGGGETIVLTDPGNQYSTASSLNTEENRAQIKKLCELYSSGKRPVVCYIGCIRGSQTAGTPSYMYYAKYNIFYNDSNGRYTINFEIVPAPDYSGTSGINGIGFKMIDQWVFNSEYNTNSDSVSFNNKAMVPIFGLERYNNNPYKYPFSLENFCTKLGLEMYSTSKTYQIGDYIYARDIIQYGPGVRLYKCNTADTTGTWDVSKWTEATFMEYLSDTLVGGALNGSY